MRVSLYSPPRLLFDVSELVLWLVAVLSIALAASWATASDSHFEGLLKSNSSNDHSGEEVSPWGGRLQRRRCKGGQVQRGTVLL